MFIHLLLIKYHWLFEGLVDLKSKITIASYLILVQGSPNFLELGSHVKIENHGQAGYNILIGNYNNNELLPIWR